MFLKVQIKYSLSWITTMWFYIVSGALCFACSSPEMDKTLEKRIDGLKKSYRINVNHNLLIIDLDGCSTCVNDLYAQLEYLKYQENLSMLFLSNSNKKFKVYVKDNCERCYLDSLEKVIEIDLIQGPSILYRKNKELYDSIPYPYFKKVL